MRALQFWILLLGSFIVSGLLVKAIFLSRSLYQEERIMTDNREITATAKPYESAWKQLALHINHSSKDDPAMAAVLKKENIVIHAAPAPGGTATPPNSTSATPQASSKSPANPALSPTH
jgi:hypothetical protein